MERTTSSENMSFPCLWKCWTFWLEGHEKLNRQELQEEEAIVSLQTCPGDAGGCCDAVPTGAWLHAVPFVFTGLSWPELPWLPALMVEVIDLVNTWQSNYPRKEKNSLSQMQPPTSRLKNKAKMGYVIGMLRSCEWGKNFFVLKCFSCWWGLGSFLWHQRLHLGIRY